MLPDFELSFSDPPLRTESFTEPGVPMLGGATVPGVVVLGREEREVSCWGTVWAKAVMETASKAPVKRAATVRFIIGLVLVR